MPENQVMMYLRKMYDREVLETMKDILRSTGEEGLKQLPLDHPSRKLYLTLKAKEREKEKKEHEEILNKFKKVRGQNP